MPRLPDTSVPKYRKHASGQTRVVLDGQTFYLGEFGSKASRMKYNQLVGEWQANGRQLPLDTSEPISVIAHAVVDQPGRPQRLAHFDTKRFGFDCRFNRRSLEIPRITPIIS